MRKLCVVTLCLGLAACASSPQHGSGDAATAWQHWQCAGGERFSWRLAKAQADTVELKLDALRFDLPRQPTGSGMLYSDGTLVFHAKGEQGLLYWAADDELVGRDCRAR
ncbi:MliC family protein [Atopomonas sediminilitoris]|uniref:MliC family protein n=1 Tax=Atopomonas sediminilitoris TaxID=2919919 RepID=UPI001F4D988C|nr:MliC family protein [Atopomonas sediminilitoris]MCJ8168246.1 MliC family protein [Atopomonas sediminilitoris]